MDNKDEYHDPDYAGTSENVKEVAPSMSEEERIEKIRKTIRREFSNELEERENEVMMIDQRMCTSRRLLHQLRYALVSSYYHDKRLQLTQDDDGPRSELSAVVRDGQRRLHPSVRKLLGKRTADLSEIFQSRQPRSRYRPDYSAMLQRRNYTVAADATKTLRPVPPPPEPEPEPEPVLTATGRPDRSKRLPKRYHPKMGNVMTIDEQRRNQKKHRYRIVIGNTSKYAPPASRADRSTHKWLLYVRALDDGGLGAVVKSVTAKLHHSYAPHHTVTLHKPPFHISRRGWGEFTAKLELHFALPELNPPTTISHTIKLDRNYTGLQTLGSETIVDVWLYSSPEMLKYAFIEDKDLNIPDIDVHTDTPTKKQTKKHANSKTHVEPPTETPTDTQTNTQTDIVTSEQIKQEPIEMIQDDSWMEFFTRDSSQLNVDEMIIIPSRPLPELLPADMDMEVETVIKEEPMDFEEHLLRPSIPDIPSEILNQPASPKKRIMKYIDPTTGKIYYIEMDRNLDPNMVQEIVINNANENKVGSPLKKVQEIVTNDTSEKVQGPVIKAQDTVPNNTNESKTNSPLKNGVTAAKKPVSLLNLEAKSCVRIESNFRHIENDHCYLGKGLLNIVKSSERKVNSEVRQKGNSEGQIVDSVSGEERMSYLKSCLTRLVEVRTAVYFLLRNIPLVDARAANPGYQSVFPFVVESDEKYWKLDFAKRRNMEWSRAKLITRLLSSRECWCWSTKHVLVFGRLHALHPVRTEPTHDIEPWGDPHARSESNIKELYQASDINTLSVFNSESFKSEVTETDQVDSDEEIDILGSETVRHSERCRVSSESCVELEPLPPSEEERLRFLFVEKMCSEIGIELRNEDIGNGYSYSAVHLTLVSALRSFAEELLRAALAAARRPPGLWGWSRGVVGLEHVYQAAGGAGGGRLGLLSARALAARRKDTTAL